MSRERDHGGRDHPTPFRTRQLSLPSPKVLRCSPWEDRTSCSRGMFSFKGLSIRPLETERPAFAGLFIYSGGNASGRLFKVGSLHRKVRI